MKNYYVIEYCDGSTHMCATKRELADVLGYAYSYINLIFRTEYFVFAKNLDIRALKYFKNGEEVQNIKRSIRGVRR